MVPKLWSEAEENIVKLNLHRDAHQLASQLPGRSLESIGRKIRRMKAEADLLARLEAPVILPPHGLVAPGGGLVENTGTATGNTAKEAGTTLEEDQSEAADRVWKNRYDELNRKYNKLLRHSSESDAFLQELKDCAPFSYQPAPSLVTTRSSAKGQPQSAVLLFSDTHVGKVVRPDQTLDFGGYDFDVFLRRLKFMEESVCSILRDHTTTEVPELVVAMLGDMLDGALLHGVEAGQRNTRFDQFYGAGHAIAQFFRSLAARVPKVRIYTAVGNHTRWDNQHKMPTENRYSNLDMFLYAYVQALTSGIPNIEWNLSTQPFCLFRVQGWLFHGSHGDHLKGGDKALGIPNHAIGRAISTTTQLFMKAGTGAPHYYLSGHLHRSITIPHALGHWIINGGFPGLDNYALAGNFNPVDPTQRFFLVHPKFGKSAEYELSLKFAAINGPEPYQLPKAFSVE
jgi:hypothetical protein